MDGSWSLTSWRIVCRSLLWRISQALDAECKKARLLLLWVCECMCVLCVWECVVCVVCVVFCVCVRVYLDGLNAEHVWALILSMGHHWWTGVHKTNEHSFVCNSNSSVFRVIIHQQHEIQSERAVLSCVTFSHICRNTLWWSDYVSVLKLWSSIKRVSVKVAGVRGQKT